MKAKIVPDCRYAIFRKALGRTGIGKHSSSTTASKDRNPAHSYRLRREMRARNVHVFQWEKRDAIWTRPRCVSRRNHEPHEGLSYLKGTRQSPQSLAKDECSKYPPEFGQFDYWIWIMASLATVGKEKHWNEKNGPNSSGYRKLYGGKIRDAECRFRYRAQEFCQLWPTVRSLAEKTNMLSIMSKLEVHI